jgi:leader peptidase (prepilin peptidase)/N-methyltransferase
MVGAVLGSFLNVVIARVPANQSIVRPRSRCPRCGATLRWYDNVPVVSWLLLRGRCRACRAPISLRYPLVELLSAGVALVALARHDLGPGAVVELAYVLVLVALAFIDLDTWLLPNALTWPLLAGGVLAAALGLAPAPSAASGATGAAIGFGTFWVVSVVGERLLGRDALGFGDVWLLAALGAWNGPAALLPIVLLASSQGALVGLVLIALGKAQPGPAPSSPGASGDAAAPSGAPPAPPGGDAAQPAPTPPPEPVPPAPADLAAAPAEDDWVPPRNAVPFGPFLVLGALQWLYLSGPIARLFPALEVFR